MIADLSPKEIAGAVRSLVEARPSPLGWEVTTPVLYSNGDFVAVIVARDAGGYVVHDASLGSMRLAAEGARIGREMSARIRAIAKRYDCFANGGRIERLYDTQDDLATSVALVANASRAVGDMVVEMRRQNESHFRYVVTESIREIAGARLRENESFKGRSGTVYRVANVILDRSLQVPFAFAVPLASRSSVPTQFRELYDLRAAYPKIYNESIYDDASDFRPNEDGWVLKQVGDVVPISAVRERLPEVLDYA